MPGVLQASSPDPLHVMTCTLLQVCWCLCGTTLVVISDNLFVEWAQPSSTLQATCTRGAAFLWLVRRVTGQGPLNLPGSRLAVNGFSRPDELRRPQQAQVIERLVPGRLWNAFKHGHCCCTYSMCHGYVVGPLVRERVCAVIQHSACMHLVGHTACHVMAGQIRNRPGLLGALASSHNFQQMCMSWWVCRLKHQQLATAFKRFCVGQGVGALVRTGRPT